MINKFKELDSKLKSKFYYNYDISKNTWFRAGGKTSIFCIVYDEQELEIILNFVDGVNYEIIGAGSNLLIRDRGFEGIILKLGKKFNEILLHDSFLEAGSSLLDINLARFAQHKSIKNFEFYSGIPGTVGGAIKMNAGCFGFETKDILKYVKIINSKGEKKIINKEKINLSYRKSSLEKGEIIIAAGYFLSKGTKEEINFNINEIKNYREKTQPLRKKTGGSTFKNPSNQYAAKLIEMADCKGLNVGDAYVSDKHANFLINNNNASAKQIEELGMKIIDRVYDKFNIKLEWEIKIIGN